MVASGDDGRAGPQEIDRDLAGDAATGSCVLAVDHNKVERVSRFQLGKPRDHGAATWLANDVAQEKYR
jgi:hypothetical protein